MFLGIFMGYALGMGEPDTGGPHHELFSLKQNLSANSAQLSAFLWAIGTTLAYYLYNRVIDEQEQQASLWGATIAWYFIIIITPVWWLLYRGNIAPPLNAMHIMLASIIISVIIRIWKKFF
jgi:hypothetical protein